MNKDVVIFYEHFVFISMKKEAEIYMGGEIMYFIT